MGKATIALYFSITMVVLVSYGYIEGVPEILANLHVFQGPYQDFTSAWYSDVGLFLVVTFILQLWLPLLKDYTSYYIIYPLRRCWHFGQLEKQSSHSFSCQSEVNVLMCGPTFDPTQKQALLLALFFTAMTFATGIPLLQFLTTIFFTFTFRAHKLFVLRFFMKPLQSGDGAMRVTLALLPIAGLLR
jgi:hypothetical protein